MRSSILLPRKPERTPAFCVLKGKITAEKFVETILQGRGGSGKTRRPVNLGFGSICVDENVLQ